MNHKRGCTLFCYIIWRVSLNSKQGAAKPETLSKWPEPGEGSQNEVELLCPWILGVIALVLVFPRTTGANAHMQELLMILNATIV